MGSQYVLIHKANQTFCFLVVIQFIVGLETPLKELFETVPRRILWHRGAVLIGHEEAVEQMGLARKDLHRSDLAVVHLIFH